MLLSLRTDDCKLQTNKKRSQPISRVLSRAIIHLDTCRHASQATYPGTARTTHYVPLFDLAPSGVYQAASGCPLRGALLPHHFTLTNASAGGLFSAALSVGSRPPGVTWHSVLWSPDFPPQTNVWRDCLANSRTGFYTVSPIETKLSKQRLCEINQITQTITYPL